MTIIQLRPGIPRRLIYTKPMFTAFTSPVSLIFQRTSHSGQICVARWVIFYSIHRERTSIICKQNEVHTHIQGQVEFSTDLTMKLWVRLAQRCAVDNEWALPTATFDWLTPREPKQTFWENTRNCTMVLFRNGIWNHRFKIITTVLFTRLAVYICNKMIIQCLSSSNWSEGNIRWWT